MGERGGKEIRLNRVSVCFTKINGDDFAIYPFTSEK